LIATGWLARRSRGLCSLNHEGREHRKLGKLAVLSQGETRLTVPHVGQIAKTEPSAVPPGGRWQISLGRGEDNFRIQRRAARDQGFETIFLMKQDGTVQVSALCLGASKDEEGDCRDEWPALPLEEGKLKVSEICLGASEQNEGDCREAWPEEFEGDGWTLENTIVSLANSERHCYIAVIAIVDSQSIFLYEIIF